MRIDPKLRVASIPPVVLQSNLGPVERVAIAVLAMRGEVSFPSIKTVAKDMGCCANTARGALHKLCKLGWLVIEPRANEHGDPTSNEYHLTIPGGGVLQDLEHPPSRFWRTVPQSLEPNKNLNLNHDKNSGSRRLASLRKEMGTEMYKSLGLIHRR